MLEIVHNLPMSTVFICKPTNPESTSPTNSFYQSPWLFPKSPQGQVSDHWLALSPLKLFLPAGPKSFIWLTLPFHTETTIKAPLCASSLCLLPFAGAPLCGPAGHGLSPSPGSREYNKLPVQWHLSPDFLASSHQDKNKTPRPSENRDVLRFDSFRVIILVRMWYLNLQDVTIGGTWIKTGSVCITCYICMWIYGDLQIKSWTEILKKEKFKEVPLFH